MLVTSSDSAGCVPKNVRSTRGKSDPRPVVFPCSRARSDETHNDATGSIAETRATCDAARCRPAPTAQCDPSDRCGQHRYVSGRYIRTPQVRGNMSRAYPDDAAREIGCSMHRPLVGLSGRNARFEITYAIINMTAPLLRLPGRKPSCVALLMFHRAKLSVPVGQANRGGLVFVHTG